MKKSSGRKQRRKGKVGNCECCGRPIDDLHDCAIQQLVLLPEDKIEEYKRLMEEDGVYDVKVERLDPELFKK